MTEDEAKTKWCPFARPDQTVAFDRVSFKRRGDCIASACMAWRWADTATETRFTAEGEYPGSEWRAAPDKIARSDSRFRLRWERDTPNRNGFCGLAGAA